MFLDVRSRLRLPRRSFSNCNLEASAVNDPGCQPRGNSSRKTPATEFRANRSHGIGMFAFSRNHQVRGRQHFPGQLQRSLISTRAAHVSLRNVAARSTWGGMCSRTAHNNRARTQPRTIRGRILQRHFQSFDRQMFIVHTVRMRNGVAESNPAAAIPSSRSGMGDNWCKSDAAFAGAWISAAHQPIGEQLIAVFG